MAGLAELLTAYTNVIADEILNECVDDIDPAKFRVLRYHGHAIPEDWGCSDRLSVWWENLRPKAQNVPCPLFPVVILHAKYQTCWREADVTTKSVTIHYTQNDADAARLAWIAECVTRRLFGLVCRANGVNEDSDPLGFAFTQIADAPVYLDTAPGGALGGAASVHWRVQTGINFIEIPSEPPLLIGRTADDTIGVDP